MITKAGGTTAATPKYLGRFAQVTQARSDYHLAQLLGVSKQAISYYRHGKRTISPQVAAVIAYHLGAELGPILGELELERQRRRKGFASGTVALPRSRRAPYQGRLV